MHTGIADLALAVNSLAVGVLGFGLLCDLWDRKGQKAPQHTLRLACFCFSVVLAVSHIRYYF